MSNSIQYKLKKCVTKEGLAHPGVYRNLGLHFICTVCTLGSVTLFALKLFHASKRSLPLHFFTFEGAGCRRKPPICPLSQWVEFCRGGLLSVAVGRWIVIAERPPSERKNDYVLLRHVELCRRRDSLINSRARRRNMILQQGPRRRNDSKKVNQKALMSVYNRLITYAG